MQNSENGIKDNNIQGSDKKSEKSLEQKQSNTLKSYKKPSIEKYDRLYEVGIGSPY